MKHIALTSLIILLVIIGVFVLFQMREALILLAAGFALSAALTPAVDRQVARGMSRTQAIGLVFGSTLLAIVGGVIVFGTLAAGEFALALDELPTWYEQTRRALVDGGGFGSRTAAMLPPLFQAVDEFATADLAVLGALALDVALRTITLTALALAVVVFGFYWLLDQQRFERLWLSLLPPATRITARALYDQVIAEVGVSMRSGVLVVAFTLFSLLALLAISGVPGATLLAIFGGIAMVVPLLGPLLGLTPIAVVAFAQSPTTGVLVTTFAAVLIAVAKLVVTPRVQRDGARVNPVLVVLLIMVLAELAGLLWIIFAPPLAAALQAATRVLTADRAALNAPSDKVAQLEDALLALEARSKEAAPSPQFADMLKRARSLVDEAEEQLISQPQS
ncbi:AI-2E family transporter [Candidatus Gracilibacteria bacterium]|nr:AI-2E family transporter [Candidatus Gracilibacteria bacterium]